MLLPYSSKIKFICLSSAATAVHRRLSIVLPPLTMSSKRIALSSLVGCSGHMNGESSVYAAELCVRATVRHGQESKWRSFAYVTFAL